MITCDQVSKEAEAKEKGKRSAEILEYNDRHGSILITDDGTSDREAEPVASGEFPSSAGTNKQIRLVHDLTMNYSPTLYLINKTFYQLNYSWKPRKKL